ncbi:hypothetical protein H671_21528 [Cricetulus griseus]|uniref:Uncharacterized protein n=1 Tax=Cricetulus griseus TaxID=10029 RepID=A0A061HTF1_CRIGR|nr:hypothetical protein H671_21528 [Cricetulus griseus]
MRPGITAALRTPKSNSPADKGDDGEPRSLRLRTPASAPRGLFPRTLFPTADYISQESLGGGSESIFPSRWQRS